MTRTVKTLRQEAEKRTETALSVRLDKQPYPRPDQAALSHFQGEYGEYNARVLRIADRLRASRVMRGLAVRDAAEQAGVAFQNWCRVETGASYPPGDGLKLYEQWLASGPQWFTRRPGEYLRVADGDR